MPYFYCDTVLTKFFHSEFIFYIISFVGFRFVSVFTKAILHVVTIALCVSLITWSIIILINTNQSISNDFLITPWHIPGYLRYSFLKTYTLFIILFEVIFFIIVKSDLVIICQKNSYRFMLYNVFFLNMQAKIMILRRVKSCRKFLCSYL